MQATIDDVPGRRDHLHGIEDRPLRSPLSLHYWRSEREILMVQRDIWKPRTTAIKAQHRSAVVDECARAEILWRTCSEGLCIVGAVLWT